jgi:hypothetical protein
MLHKSVATKQENEGIKRQIANTDTRPFPFADYFQLVIEEE